MHAAPTRASAGSTDWAVTSTVWSATEAGAPPRARSPRRSQAARRAARCGQCERVGAGDEAQASHRSRAAPGTSSSARARRAAACVASGIPAPRASPPDGRRVGRIATGQLSCECACHDRRAAATREPEDADHRPLLRRRGRRRLRPRLGRLEQEGLDGRSGRREDAAALLRERRARPGGHGASTVALAETSSRAARERSRAGGRRCTWTSPPETDTRACVRDQPGSAHARPRAGRRRRRARAQRPPPRSPQGRSSSPRQAAAPRRAPPRAALEAGRVARGWPARARR